MQDFYLQHYFLQCGSLLVLQNLNKNNLQPSSGIPPLCEQIDVLHFGEHVMKNF